MNRARLSMLEAAAQAANLREVGEPVPVCCLPASTKPEPSLTPTQRLAQPEPPTPQPAAPINLTSPPAPPAPPARSTPRSTPVVNQTAGTARSITPQPSTSAEAASAATGSTGSPFATQSAIVTPSNKRPAPEVLSNDRTDQAIPFSKKARQEPRRLFQPFQPTASSRKKIGESANFPPPPQPQHKDSQIPRPSVPQNLGAAHSLATSSQNARQPYNAAQTPPALTHALSRNVKGRASIAQSERISDDRLVPQTQSNGFSVGKRSSTAQAQLPRKDVQLASSVGSSRRHVGTERKDGTQVSLDTVRDSHALTPVLRNQVRVPQATSLPLQQGGELSSREGAYHKRAGPHEQKKSSNGQPARSTQEGTHPDPKLEAFLREKNTSLPNFLRKFGLVVIDPRDGDTSTWVACKFCPTFHCRKRSPEYIMMYRTPFEMKSFSKHLVREHPTKWKEYTRANDAEKSKFFDDHDFPPKETFMERLLVLRKAWSQSGGGGSSQGKDTKGTAAPSGTAEKTSSTADATESDSANAAKHAVTRDNCILKRIYTDCQIGGIRFDEFSCEQYGVKPVHGGRIFENQSSVTPGKAWSRCRDFLEVKVGKPNRMRLDRKGRLKRILTGEVPKCFEEFFVSRTGSILPGIPDLILNGILSDKNVRPASAESGFFWLHDYDKRDVGKELVMHSQNKAWMRILSSTVLFYLTRGVSLDIVNELLIQTRLAVESGIREDEEAGVKDQEKCCEEEEKIEASTGKQDDGGRAELVSDEKGNGHREDRRVLGDGNGQNGDVHAVEVEDREEGAHVTQEGQRAGGRDYVDCETRLGLGARESGLMGKWLQSRDVWNCGNSICAEALMLLWKLHGTSLNWAFCLGTRRCAELGEGGVDILVQLELEFGVQVWVHLVAVRGEEGVEEAAKSMLECAIPQWRERLVGLRSGLGEGDVKERGVERRVLEMLKREEGVWEGLLHLRKGEEDVKMAFAEMTGVQLVGLLQEHKVRYSKGCGGDRRAELMSKIDEEKEKLRRVSGKLSYGLDEIGALEKVHDMAPETCLMVRRLKKVWEFGVDTEPGARRLEDELGWVDSGRGGEGAVNVLLERVMLARQLIVLDALENSHPKRARRSRKQTLLNVEEALWWARNAGPL